MHCFLPQAPGDSDQNFRFQTLSREQDGILVSALNERGPRFIYFTDLSNAWMAYHFPQFEIDDTAEQALESKFREGPEVLSRELSSGEEAFSHAVARHWSTDRFWTDANDQLNELRRVGKFTLDLNAIQERIFADDSAAYKPMEAMTSVWQREGWDGYRGAPRVLLLLLARLAEQCSQAEASDPDSDRS